jgi:Polysaccharide pyruvyl transferase
LSQIPGTDRLQAVLLNDTSSIDHYGCQLVIDQIRARCTEAGIDIVHSVKLDEDWRSAEHAKHVASAKIVIVNGEGSMHHSREIALRLASSADFCRQRGIKSFLINSVYQDNSDQIADLVRLFHRVFVRESNSQAALAAQGIRAQVVPDMSLSFSPGAAEVGSDRKGILFSDSVDHAVSVQLYERFKRCENAHFVTLNVPVEEGLVPRELEIPRGLEIQANALAVRLLGRLSPRSWRRKNKRWRKKRLPFHEPSHASFVELFDRIATSQLIVTGRFHMICLALLAKTPFIALPSNTHKIEGLLDDAGLAHRFVAPAKLPGAIRAYSRWHEGELVQVEAYIERAHSSIAEMFSAIRASVI